MRGAWSRAVLVAVTGEERPTAEVDSLEIKPGTVVGRVGECVVTLRTDRVPPRIWEAMVSYAQGRGALAEAVEGRAQSSHLQHLMSEDWEEPLVPRSALIRRACTCDEGGTCEHIAAVGVAFADAIEADPRELLRWRGCLAGEEISAEEMWEGGELPEPAEPRPMPVGAVLKRLGPSGIAVGEEDLAYVLERAYEAFAQSGD